MKAVVVTTENAADHRLERAFIRADRHADDLTLPKTRSPRIPFQ